jgi:hypothetical protein
MNSKEEMDSCLLVVKNVGQHFQEHTIAWSADERWLGYHYQA